jgi:hypothetical protein
VTYVPRQINVVFTFGVNAVTGMTGKFANGTNTLTLTGYRVSFEMSVAGGLSQPSAQVLIYGMDISDMNALSSLGTQWFSANQNMVTVLAGDQVHGFSQVFQGTINECFVDFTAMPQVAMNVTAQATGLAALVPVPPNSYSGVASVASIMSSFAQDLTFVQGGNWSFENNGVTATLRNPYFPGTLLRQIYACAQAANINVLMHNNVLAIWPKNGIRGSPVPTVSVDSGLTGYPTYTNFGVDFTTLFNPNLVVGGNVIVQSSLKPACGTWTVYSLNHRLESITPDGDWFTDVSTNAVFAQQVLG